MGQIFTVQLSLIRLNSKEVGSPEGLGRPHLSFRKSSRRERRRGRDYSDSVIVIQIDPKRGPGSLCGSRHVPVTCDVTCRAKDIKEPESWVMNSVPATPGSELRLQGLGHGTIGFRHV